MKTAFSLISIAAFVLLPMGCSETKEIPVLHHVEGKVTFEGKPAGGAIVLYHPVGDDSAESIKPRAISGTDGKYVLSYVGDEDGAPAGEYRVTVKWTRSGDHPEQGTDLLPSRYHDSTSSGLRVTVKAESRQVIDLNLKRKP